MKRTNNTTPPVDGDGNDLDQLRVKIDLKYYSRAKEKPSAMRQEAFHGLAGEVVNIVAPVTEACPEALLVQLLVCLGNAIGRDPWFNQADYHHTNEYMVLVGDTGAGRKGTSLRAIRGLLKEVDPGWDKNCVHKGIQTGEALISAIRDDKVIIDKKGKANPVTGEVPTMIQKGVDDKRMLIVEEEFARFLGVGLRKGNPLSATVREAFDSPLYLSAKSKTDPETATGAHVSLLAHVTPIELLSILNRVEVGNGFINRMLFIESRETKRMPRAIVPDWLEYPELIRNIKDAIEFAKNSGRMQWSHESGTMWDNWYKTRHISGGSIGSILARAEAHVLRLAMIYALLDWRTEISVRHLKAAMAVWDYAAQSAKRIFGNTTGDKLADRIYAFTLRNGASSRTDIHEALNRNVSSADIDMALFTLVGSGLVKISPEERNGALVELVSPVTGWN